MWRNAHAGATRKSLWVEKCSEEEEKSTRVGWRRNVQEMTAMHNWGLGNGEANKFLDRHTDRKVHIQVVPTKKNMEKYQPSREGSTRSPPATPAKSKMAARGPQNGRRGLERCLPLGFWAF